MTWGQGAGWQASSWFGAYWFGPDTAESPSQRPAGSAGGGGPDAQLSLEEYLRRFGTLPPRADSASADDDLDLLAAAALIAWFE